MTKDTETDALGGGHSSSSRRREASAELRETDWPSVTRWGAAPQEIVDRLGALPDRERDVVVLHFLEGLSVAEIVAARGDSAWMVRRMLQLAVARLRSAVI